MNHFINVGKSFNPAGKFIVMFAQPSIDLADRYSIANRIFHMMYNHYRVIHVVVCISAGYLKYDVYLTNPYRNPGHCGKFLVKCICKKFRHQIVYYCELIRDVI